jgi:alkanesulfonate monooxygenase SsuD/methylene tetrahydromethanopterin reductase-like flavin-dependent oxidoreductase (luciferase family)
MRLSLGMMFQNFFDWDRFLALERGDHDVGEQQLPDWKAWKEHLDIFLQADELGFDALWSVEHHFTPYCLIPDPLQLLTYIAGATKHIDVGSMVCVLPWWQPLKLVEEVSMLQTVLGDERRLHIGVGRGLARREYRSLGIEMDESRERFDEVLQVLKMALTNERFSFDGQHFQIPPTSLRPFPKDGEGLVDRIYGAWGSQPSIRVIAEAGIRPFLNPQKPLGDYDKDLREFRQVREEEMGLPPVPPTIVLFGYCAETQEQAIADATRYSGEYHQTAMTHYEIGGEHLAKLKTYQQYALPAGVKLQPMRPEDLFYVDQIVGTPDECIRRIEHVKDKYGCEELIMQVIYGGMPPEAAEKSIQLFGREVVPAVHEMGVAAMVG